MKHYDETEPVDLSGLLAAFKPSSTSPLDATMQKTVLLARKFQERARFLQTPPERKQQAELDRMLQNPGDKATLVQITDQAFRSRSARRAVDQFIHILDVQGVPRFFGAVERTLLKGFQSFGGYLPDVAVPLVRDRMQKETANVILPAEPTLLQTHLQKRTEQGLRMNVNILGEAILGEQEAQRRLEHYLEMLQWPEIEVVSVKISTLYSQISALARQHTVAILCDRLEVLFRSAARAFIERSDGSRFPKFVYLDMEEYRDMDLTAEAFMRTLDRPGLESVSAGLALQAYIPDSSATQRRLNDWARRRLAQGGAPITIRLVKGANLEMERVEASLKDWPQAPFKSKLETDANYKRMLEEGLRAENIAAVHLGVASHNLFEVAYALVLAEEGGHLDHVQFEMLEGMANHQRRALCELNSNMLLYAPVCRKVDFIHAIGYLIRRLDENTGPDNFLRHSFKLEVGSADWQRLETCFVESYARKEGLVQESRRRQDRHQWPDPVNPVEEGWSSFRNEPDTDFALPRNSDWARECVALWKERCDARALEIPLVVAGREIYEARRAKNCLDPSRPGVVVGRYQPGTTNDVTAAVACAREDPDGWRGLDPDHRYELLGGVAQEIRKARADLIGAALADGGKTISESDPEVSEAVDFVEFYRATSHYFQTMPGLRARGKGLTVVVSPWNFPVAIPAGGIAAALAAGNTVILKPASDAVLVAWQLCQCFWRAGVSKRALQFLPCAGGSEGTILVSDPRVDCVVLTGGTKTALDMLRVKPDLYLLAETGGKNATIVTALSDQDQAIKNILQSAFSHSGQKCSATSLLLLEAEIYEDTKFRATLCDAVQSMIVGSAWDLETKMGPLIRPPSGDLEAGLKTLEPGESWAVMPRPRDSNPCLWTPGVKWGVQPGNFTHMTELFGPVLGVMRFEKLEDAVALVNQTGYGLTSGLESLDDREQKVWQGGIRAGNLYINRPTTGAVVLRQPFGGLGKSAYGPGIKAGGPNYVVQLMEFETVEGEGTNAGEGGVDAAMQSFCQRLRDDTSSGVAQVIDPDGVERLCVAVASYLENYRNEFGRNHDHFRLIGQDNLRRYQSILELRVRVDPRDSLFEIFARVCAAKIAGSRVTVSLPPDLNLASLTLLERLTEPWAGGIEFVEESDERLADMIRHEQTDRIRYARRQGVPPQVWAAAGEVGLCVATAPVLAEGRIELLWYVREQSLSLNYHRYGNLGSRGGEVRKEPG
jgi:RHH-type transcriptional regulator, proline utilization regulon repressor / proline dehydrogenase / delta 1-pyrroline-5-carboxylate dehydrogenase